MNHVSNYDPNTIGMPQSVASVNSVFNWVYGWMTVGLLLSAVTAYTMATMGYAITIAQSGFSTVLLLLEVGLVIGISAGIRKLPVVAAIGLFSLFSIVNGASLSLLLLIYEEATLQTVFFITAAMFAGLALFGTVTKKRLDGIGGLCGMALWGIIIASLVNLFLKSSGLNLVMSYIGVAVFVGLTAWDAQKIRRLAEQSHMMTTEEIRKYGILGALTLYLDFINLFLLLLRLFGGNGRRN